MSLNYGKKFGKGAIVTLCAIFIIPAMALAFGQGGFGQGKGHGMKGDHKGGICGIWKNPEIVKELNLTDDQVNQLKDADFTFREKHIALKSQMASLRLQMDKAFSADTVDEAAVRNLAGQTADVKGQMFKQKIESRLMVHKLLNADQLDKMKTYRMKRMGSHGKRGMGRQHRGSFNGGDAN